MKSGRKTRWVAAVMVALVFAAGLSSFALAQTSPAQLIVEGQGDYFVTGESYPTRIQMAGYSSRDNKLYLNFDLETTKSGTGRATFKYFVEVFDGDGAVLGTVGSYNVPVEASGTEQNPKTATVTNKEVDLGSNSLTAAYRVVITVKEVTIQ